jgi:hypothetical protein
MHWYGEDLQSHIKLPDTLPQYVESDDIKNLKDAMRSKRTHKKVIERNILIIDFITKTGLRRKELSTLKVKDIDITRQCLVVRQGKGMKDRTIDLVPSLVEVLRGYLKDKDPDSTVFNLKASTISGLIRWAAKKAGVDIHTHSLRHLFGQSLIDTGSDVEVVRELMGHSKLSTTQQYLGRSNKQCREAIDRLDNVEPRLGSNDDIGTGGRGAGLESEDVTRPPSCFERDERSRCRNGGLCSDCGPCLYLRFGITQEDIDRIIEASRSLADKVKVVRVYFESKSTTNYLDNAFRALLADNKSSS